MEKYNNLEIIKKYNKISKNNKKRIYALCKCECGNVKEIRYDSIKSGKTRSCGCLHLETAIKNFSSKYTHEKSGTRLYKIWTNMKQRCSNYENTRFDSYGGRGINICDEWLNFEVFYEWSMQNGYSDLLTIDRIDNNKSYHPNNCRWVDNKIQCNNRNSNIIVEYEGNEITLKQFSEKIGIDYSVINARYNRGDRSIERLCRPIGKGRNNKGISNHKSKLTENQVIEIKKMLKVNIPGSEISNKLGVSKYVVSDIKRGKTWKHVTI